MAVAAMAQPAVQRNAFTTNNITFTSPTAGDVATIHGVTGGIITWSNRPPAVGQPANTTLTNWTMVTVVTNVQQLTNAVKVVSNTVMAVEGLYNLGATVMPVTNGVKLVGMGNETTILFNSASSSDVIQINDNTYFKSLKIVATNGNQIAGLTVLPIVNKAGTTATNVLIEDCEVRGWSDSCYLRAGAQVRFVRCLFYSAWDNGYLEGGLAEFHTCSFVTRSLSIADVMAGLKNTGGTSLVYNCVFDVQGGTGGNHGIVCSGGRVEVYGGKVYSSSTYGSISSVNQSGSGAVLLYGTQLSAPVIGTVTSSVRLLSIEGSLGREIRNVTSASGRYTNAAATDRFIAFDVSSAAGTNTLPDIGYKITTSVIVSNQPANNNTYVLNGTTFTWKTSAGAVPEVQIGATQGDSALNLWLAILNQPWGVDSDLPTATNVIVNFPADFSVAHSQTGTWGVLTSVTNDYPTTEGRLITVYDSKGSAASRNIKVVPQRLALINGQASYLITNNYGAAAFQAVGTNWVAIAVAPAGAGGGGGIGGADTQIQYNNLGVQDGASGVVIPASNGETNLNVTGVIRDYKSVSTNSIEDQGWAMILGPQTNGNTLTVSNTVTVVGTNNGAIRLFGTNTGWNEFTVPSDGNSNSVVMRYIAPVAGQFPMFQSVSTLAGTNQVQQTNATFASGWGAHLAVSPNAATLTAYATNALTLMPTNAVTYQADFTGGTPLHQTADFMRTNVSVYLTNPIVGRVMTFHFRGDGNAVDRTVSVLTNGLTGNWPISWGWNSPTNGATSFTVTNNIGAELNVLVLSNRFSAFWQPVR